MKFEWKNEMNEMIRTIYTVIRLIFVIAYDWFNWFWNDYKHQHAQNQAACGIEAPENLAQGKHFMPNDD